jgi:hypothetical protein
VAGRHPCAWYAVTGEGLQPALLRLAEALLRVDDFFGSLGGLPWYQLRCLRFIADSAAQRETDAATSSGSILADRRASSNGAHSSNSGAASTLNGSGRANAVGSGARNGVDSSAGAGDGFGAGAAGADADEQFHMPCGVDLECSPQAARRAAAQGLQALPYMAEIYPIGGEAVASSASQLPHGSLQHAAIMHSTDITEMEAVVTLPTRRWRSPGSHRRGDRGERADGNAALLRADAAGGSPA